MSTAIFIFINNTQLSKMFHVIFKVETQDIGISYML